MSPWVILMVLVSSCMHAAWNLLARQRGAEIAFFQRMLLLTIAVGFLPTIISETISRSLTFGAWMCVSGSGVCCAVYFYSLGRAYGCADFTTVYPIARALPVLVVALGDVLRGRCPSTVAWVGMMLVVCGCALAPLVSLSELAIRKYVNRSALWLVLTAVGTAGYTLFDKEAAEVVKQGPATAARYGYMFFLMTGVAYSILARRSKHIGVASEGVGWKLPLVAACLDFGGYWLILWAYQLTRQASYVSAFRQASILIGVVLAFVLYHEKGIATRLSGAILITTGLVLVGLFGH